MYAPAPVPDSAATSLTRPGMGAAYGTAKAGVGIAGIGTYRSDLIMKVRHALCLLSLRR
jgi:V-type H+-transporting ATPase proteolipid subunit